MSALDWWRPGGGRRAAAEMYGSPSPGQGVTCVRRRRADDSAAPGRHQALARVGGGMPTVEVTPPPSSHPVRRRFHFASPRTGGSRAAANSSDAGALRPARAGGCGAAAAGATAAAAATSGSDARSMSLPDAHPARTAAEELFPDDLSEHTRALFEGPCDERVTAAMRGDVLPGSSSVSPQLPSATLCTSSVLGAGIDARGMPYSAPSAESRPPRRQAHGDGASGASGPVQVCSDSSGALMPPQLTQESTRQVSNEESSWTTKAVGWMRGGLNAAGLPSDLP
jgi:hypothetical protein